MILELINFIRHKVNNIISGLLDVGSFLFFETKYKCKRFKF